VLYDAPAAAYISMGVGGPIAALACPRDAAEIEALVACCLALGIPFLPLGNGTNLIVREGGYPGLLISLAGLRGLTWQDGENGTVQVEAQAGVPLAELVSLSLKEGLTGMVFCAGIPGSVGGAVRMNAGAYGGEIKDCCQSVQLWSPGEGLRTLPRSSLPFGYRILDLPAEMIIIGAVFRLERGACREIAATVQGILTQRRDKHPLEYRNAGSIFKNPKGMPAGRLIEEAGLKGMRIGDAQVSEKHGNFIVNRGQATAEEILRLIERIRERVLAATGIALQAEVKIIGVP
jgi:UDP-N-acetylmuramate dehydrogenase